MYGVRLVQLIFSKFGMMLILCYTVELGYNVIKGT
jgi:hypothetical protein